MLYPLSYEGLGVKVTCLWRVGRVGSSGTRWGDPVRPLPGIGS